MASRPANGERGRAGASGALLAEARNVSKAFTGVLANDRVDFELRAGEIHALLGENGAGKSTLASILTGLYSADSGEIRVAGQPVSFRSPRDALARGVGIIHQHFHLVDRFTVAENIVLGDTRQGFFMSPAGIRRAVADLGDRYGLEIAPDATVAELSLGERQRVEIVKMLVREVDVLFLDEPTAVLAPGEVEALFATLRRMADDGKAIALVTHKLNEVFSICDRATVMRGGKVVAAAAIEDFTPETIARAMVGRDVDLKPRPSTRPPGAVVLAASGLGMEAGHHCGLHGIDLEIRAGEIVGIAGVAGNGQLQLAEVLAGLQRPDAGKVTVNGTDVTGKGPHAARKAGLAYVPEDRLGTGLASGLSIADNLMLTSDTGFLFDRSGSRKKAAAAIGEYRVKASGPEEVVRRLSGGNVQKILLARELGSQASVFVVASPARGLDVAGIEFVRNLLQDYRDRGAAILLISEDLDEVRLLSDRIVVMHAGHITHQCAAVDYDEAAIGLAISGYSGGGRFADTR
jgi:simple sugar transport system ATP-binding protein